MKTKTIQKGAIFATALAGVSVAIATVGFTKSFSSVEAEAETSDLKMSVTLGDEITVRYLLPKEAGYTSPSLTVNGKMVTAEETEEGYLFTYSGVTPATVSEKLSAVITEEGKADIKRDASVADYWHSVFTSTEETGAENIALRSVAANFLNYAKYCGGSVELTSEENKLLYNYENNNSTTLAFDSNAENVSVEGVSLNAENGAVTLSFRAEGYRNLTARISEEGKDYAAKVVATENGYAVTSRAIKPTEYCSDVVVTLFADGKTIGTAITSVNGAIKANESDKTKAMYVYGKAAAWAAYADELGYYTNLPAAHDNGIREFAIFDYKYDDERMLTTNQGVWGSPVVYVDGVAYGENQSGTQTDKYTVAYANGTFTVTLKGGELSTGISAENANLVLSVEKDTTVQGSCYRNWDRKVSGSVIVGDDYTLAVTGGTGKTLTLSGNGIYSQSGMTIDGATVKVSTVKEESAAYTGGDLTIEESGALLLVNENKVFSSVGVRTDGDIVVNGGTLSVSGYETGIAMNKCIQDTESEETSYFRPELLVTGNAPVVTVSGSKTGITMYAGDNQYDDFNGTLTIDTGYVTVQAEKAGVSYADVTVGTGKLNVTVHGENGVAIGGIGMTDGVWDGWNWWEGHEYLIPAKVTTTSANPFEGEIQISCESEGTVGIETKGMALNGGKLTMDMDNGGAIVFPRFTTMNFDLCDVNITYVNGASNNAFHDRNNLGSVVNVGSKCWMTIKNCGLPFASWSREVMLEIYIAGRVEVSGAKSAIGDWEDTAQIKSGEIL